MFANAMNSVTSHWRLLLCSLLAAQIPECAGFADVGGFVYALPELNKIAANAGECGQCNVIAALGWFRMGSHLTTHILLLLL